MPLRNPDGRSASRRMAAIVGLVTAMLHGPGDALPQSPADSAWMAGDTRTAGELYAARLAADSTDELALHRVALMRAWDANYNGSLELFGRLLAASPQNLEARVGRARVLAWMGDLTGAIEEVDLVLDADPAYVPALEARARFEAWRGDLVESERRWRDAVRRVPGRASLHAGLGQTLRWQGRNAAAYRELNRAAKLAPGQPLARDELRALDFDLRPRGEPGLLFTNDSDQNDIITLEGDAGWYPSPSVRVTAEAYFRNARFGGPGTLERSAGGVQVGASTTLEPGWNVGARVGVSGSDGSAGSTGRFTARVRTPRRHRIVGTLDASTGPLDESAVLIENGVTVGQLQVAGVARPGPDWRFDASASVARFEGSEPNRRLAGSLAAGRTLSSAWTVGVFARAFGFEKQLTEGYFSPDLYWITELTGTWKTGTGSWRFTLDAAPGIQQVGAGGDTGATIRAGGRASYSFGPGRELSLSGLYSTTGLNSFATGDASYRYLAVGLHLTWAAY